MLSTKVSAIVVYQSGGKYLYIIYVVVILIDGSPEAERCHAPRHGLDDVPELGVWGRVRVDT